MGMAQIQTQGLGDGFSVGIFIRNFVTLSLKNNSCFTCQLHFDTCTLF